ncbi:MAG: SDR family NAD(P)-dependent oxidoreductase [SAR324 cluster bacterium]|nr:SDR family NAD(P)-dependent oxidoreductase [SAR324 cluster bacterium]
METFQDRTAVVTGAASGIGKALALALARRGMKLVLADIEPGPLGDAEKEIAATGAETLAVPTDVSSLPSVRALADQAFTRFGAVHVLCNNAGVAIGGALQEARHEDWEWVLGVNLWGVIHGIEAFVPRMIEAKQGGHIVNTASMAGLIASKGLGIYNTTKYAVVGLSETLAKDLRDDGIGVSVLCPMGVSTRIRESERNRPEALGGGSAADSGASNSGASNSGASKSHGGPDLVGRYLPPEEIAAMAVEAIENGRLYIPTHYEGLEFWQRRATRIGESFPKPPA